jgi:hypothetical protein
MKRSKFKIKTKNRGLVEVSGLISKYFGFHKFASGGYSVTHLNTGYQVCTVSKTKQAREIIELLETAVFPYPWNRNDVGGLKRNIATTASIVNAVLYNKES